MKIKLLILSDDKLYTQRISTALSKYSSSLELYMFDNIESAYDCAEKTDIDIFVSERAFKIDAEKIPAYCVLAYFVDDASVTKIDDCYAIGKYQSIDATYKRIAEMYSSISGRTVTKKKTNTSNAKCKKILFTSFSGGMGVSSMAVSAAVDAAKSGYRVLYLSLEDIPTTNSFFKGNGNQNFSQVIYELKSNPNKNIQLKLNSLVSRSDTGVFFYKEPDSAIDMNELSWDNIYNLVNQLSTGDSYDLIIVDWAFSNEQKSIAFMETFDNIVIVCDGAPISNRKSEKAIEMIKIYEQNYRFEILSKAVLVYNKFSNKTGKEMTVGNLRDLQGIPRLEQATPEEVINHIQNRHLFTQLF